MDVKLNEVNQTFVGDYEEQNEALNAKFAEVHKTGGVSKETDPTVPDWAKQPEKPSYRITEIEGGVGEEFVESLIANKQDKNIIVTKDSEGKATLTPSEIMAHVNAGTTVYFTEQMGASAYHQLLEGYDSAVYFYSSFFNASSFTATCYEIDSNRKITRMVWRPSHMTDTTIHITAAERQKWNNAIDDLNELTQRVVDLETQLDGFVDVSEVGM